MEEVSLKMPARLEAERLKGLERAREQEARSLVVAEARLLKLLAVTFHLFAALSIVDRWVYGSAERATVSGDGDTAVPAIPTHVHIMHPE